jgi:DNA-binding transcriptional ArsR family regulator
MLICIYIHFMVKSKDIDCACGSLHGKALEKASGLMPSDGVIEELAGLYKVFGDPTRVKILCGLMSSELCVCDIAVLVGMSQSAVSHQLRVLKNLKIVKHRRDGKTVFYSLEDQHVRSIIRQGIDHMHE